MADMADRASIERERHLTEQIRQAVSQSAQSTQVNLDDECIDCGNPIGIKRKIAMPSAMRCIACQTKLEGNRRKR